MEDINKIDNTDKKLCISDVNDNLFNRLKDVMIEYCYLNDDASLESELEYHIKSYEKYIQCTKNFYNI